ncbi:hypothetical protein V8E54_013734 [Elaphomyces granulatus]
MPVTVPPRPRGRPRRQAISNTAPSRPRGRPPTLETAPPRPRRRPQEHQERPLAFISEFHNVPEDLRVHNLGTMDQECDKCHALFWKEELVPPSNPRQPPNFSNCCKKGDIVLPPFSNPPQLLRDLYMGVHELSSEFRKNIRRYNSTLAFTSILYTPDRRLGPTLLLRSPVGNRFSTSTESRFEPSPSAWTLLRDKRIRELFLVRNYVSLWRKEPTGVETSFLLLGQRRDRLKKPPLRHVCLLCLSAPPCIHLVCSFVLILDSHSAIYIHHSTQRSSCSLRVMNPCISSR